jgi:phospholipid/cholesterol/gamma-HCH transport system ATP-binding protein
MIQVKNIHKSFGDNHVLKGIGAEFDKGRCHLIIGRSGSGKTVFIKSLLGLYEIDQGSIYYGNREFTQMNLKARKEIRREMGMVFQGGALFDSMTIEENVLFPLRMFSDLKYKKQIERVNFCLDRVNLQDVNKLFPSEISGGMQKRVAIARAIALNPKYLFCDEPNSGLDPQTAIVIDQLLKEITEDFDMTTLINTHDMNSVMEIGDHIMFIKEGTKAWEGNKDNLTTTMNKDLEEFVFSSRLFQQIRDLQKSK